MSCKYIDNCPCHSGWCKGSKQDYEKCIPFLITAHERVTEELERSEDKAARQQDTINRIRRICDNKAV